MHDHVKKNLGGDKIVLVGNPNVGKSVLFNLLTSTYVTVSNYPGTTVEISQGTASFTKDKVIIDTPGVNSITPLSEDEKVTRDVLIKDNPTAVIQVIDSKNLARGLLVTLQLLEMDIPLVVDLNMSDEAGSRGIKIDDNKLSDILGVDVVSTVAIQKQGVKELQNSILDPRMSGYRVKYTKSIEEAVDSIGEMLSGSGLPKRACALMLLSGDKDITVYVEERIGGEKTREILNVVENLSKRFSSSLAYIINKQRLSEVSSIVDEVYKKEHASKTSFTTKLGNLSMHPIWGIPILAFVLFATYTFVGEFGAQTLVEFMESTVFGGYVNPWTTKVIERISPYPLITEFFVGEYGAITVALSYGFAIILPIVGTFFIVFSILEDTGYLPRLAVMLDKSFGLMGLNGKAVLPMILGLGCDTMATMTTRILESRKERIQVTLLLALGIPCSAQLGVILGMIGNLGAAAVAVWISVVVAVLIAVGYLSSRVIPGEKSDFIMEIPPLRVPQLENILTKTLARIEWYLREVVPLFILGTAVLFVIDKIQVLTWLEDAASPLVVGFLGLPAKATGAFIIGFLRRDYGAAGLFVLARQGLMDEIQVIVSLVTITLFVPCIANFFMMVKERGLKTAIWMVVFIFPFAFIVGGILNHVLRAIW